MTKGNKAKFVASAHAPTNGDRFNVLNLLKNKPSIHDGQRPALEQQHKHILGNSKLTAEKTKVTKFRRVHDPAKILAAEGEGEEEEEDEAEEEEDVAVESSPALLESSSDKHRREAAESLAALRKHEEEIRGLKKRRAAGPKVRLCARVAGGGARLITGCFLAVTSGCRAVYKMLAFAYAFLMWELFGRTTHKVGKKQYLLEKYIDQRGELVAAFRALSLDDEEKMRWVELWAKIDSNGDNSMDFKEFVKFFNLPKNLYTERLFGIMNRNYNGVVNIRDFVITAWQYCAFDKDRVAELAFRLISRRGDTFDPDITIIDLVDIDAFVEIRYNQSGRKSKIAMKKKGVAVFSFIDTDGSGGVGFGEFELFSKTNPIFLYYAHWYQTMLRTAIFGEQYWRDSTNDRPMMYTRDGLQESLLRDNIVGELLGMGILPYDPKVSRKGVKKFKEDFPDAWYAAKEKGFLLKQALKQKQDVATDMAKETYSRLIKVFTKLIPDSMGMRPAFNQWKDWTEYDRSIAKDGGESYRLKHMNLLDVKQAVTAQSLGKTTVKLAAMKQEREQEENKLTIHEEVLLEAAKGKLTEDDLTRDLIFGYAFDTLHHTPAKTDRLRESLYSSGFSPEKYSKSLGKKGLFELDEREEGHYSGDDRSVSSVSNYEGDVVISIHDRDRRYSDLDLDDVDFGLGSDEKKEYV